MEYLSDGRTGKVEFYCRLPEELAEKVRDIEHWEAKYDSLDDVVAHALILLIARLEKKRREPYPARPESAYRRRPGPKKSNNP
jgi:hypothetical protein